MLVYDIGDRRKLSCTIRNEAGALADPSELSFIMLEPNSEDNEVTEYEYGTDIELVRASAGVYYVLWDCTVSGAHNWRYEATGTISAAEEGRFWVRRSLVEEVS